MDGDLAIVAAMAKSSLLLLAALLLTSCAGSANDSLAPPDPLTSVFALPEVVPNGLLLEGGCWLAAREGSGLAVVAYRGDGRYITAERSRPALLRIFLFDTTSASLVATEEGPLTLDEVLEEAVPDSVQEISVRGVVGYAFEEATAEPSPTPWPALAWKEGPLIVWVLGEGLDQTTVLDAAESLTPVPPGAFTQRITDVC